VNAVEFTVFAVKFKTLAALDLMRPPLDADRALWTARTDYAACQTLVDHARAAGIEVLRYESARDPDPARGVNLALLTCRTFASREPFERQTWRIHLGPQGVRALCEFPDQRLGYDRRAFADDARIARLRWER
jgi:hypothetical protein